MKQSYKYFTDYNILSILLFLFFFFIILFLHPWQTVSFLHRTPCTQQATGLSFTVISAAHCKRFVDVTNFSWPAAAVAAGFCFVCSSATPCPLTSWHPPRLSLLLLLILFCSLRLLGLLLGCDWFMLRSVNIWKHTLCYRFIAFHKNPLLPLPHFSPTSLQTTVCLPLGV